MLHIPHILWHDKSPNLFQKESFVTLAVRSRFNCYVGRIVFIFLLLVNWFVRKKHVTREVESKKRYKKLFIYCTSKNLKIRNIVEMLHKWGLLQIIMICVFITIYGSNLFLRERVVKTLQKREEKPINPLILRFLYEWVKHTPIATHPVPFGLHKCYQDNFKCFHCWHI